MKMILTKMQTEKNTIKLENFRAPGAKVFTGRDRGEQVRRDSQIDELEKKFEEVYFVIPDNIYSINPSFFEELFENVVNKLNRDGFEKKFKFINQGQYNFQKPLDEAIERLLRKKTALTLD